MIQRSAQMKPKIAARSQQRQRTLDKRHIDIGAIKDRAKAPPIFSHQHVGDQFLPHVGRVADNVCEFLLERQQQEIALPQPSLAQGAALRCRQTVFLQHFRRDGAGLLVAGAMQFDRDDAIAEVRNDIALVADFATIGLKQAVDDRRKEIAVTHRRLKDSGAVKRFVVPCNQPDRG